MLPKSIKELLKQQNDEKALTAQIRELDQGTQDSHILSLKYSLVFANNRADKAN